MKKATLQTDGTWKVEEFTSEEVTDYNATVASGKAKKQADADAITKKATDQAAATTKLKALGLTDDEIVALIN
tara:strand:+ start:820 stop:1038 length:219 start_codon:yes stop_codon:yes gene_type:complete